MKYLFYSVLFLFASCNKTSKSITVPQQKQDVSGVIISYQASACFGKCPVFNMTINGSAQTITYSGRMNVEKIGVYTRHYEADSIAALVTAFEIARFYELNEKYLGKVVDFPSVIISYSNNGKSKTVTDRVDGPPQLKALENRLYILSNSQGWTKTEKPEEN